MKEHALPRMAQGRWEEVGGGGEEEEGLNEAVCRARDMYMEAVDGLVYISPFSLRIVNFLFT